MGKIFSKQENSTNSQTLITADLVQSPRLFITRMARQASLSIISNNSGLIFTPATIPAIPTIPTISALQTVPRTPYNSPFTSVYSNKSNNSNLSIATPFIKQYPNKVIELKRQLTPNFSPEQLTETMSKTLETLPEIKL